MGAPVVFDTGVTVRVDMAIEYCIMRDMVLPLETQAARTLN